MTPIKCFWLEPTGREEKEEFPGGGSITRPIYRRVDTGEEMHWQAAPVGAMTRADWLETMYKGDDGICLVVKMPANADGSGKADWVIDGESSNGGRPWKRTGTPPNVTVTPSIFMFPNAGGFHGWLRNGEITSV